MIANSLQTTCGDYSRADGFNMVASGFHPTQDPIVEEEGSPSLGATSRGMAVSFAENQQAEPMAFDAYNQTESRETHTLRKATGDGIPLVGHNRSAVRRLTPTECERLMSWPDGWTAVDGDKTPDNRRYAACGNGVVSNVSEWIGRRIVAVDNE